MRARDLLALLGLALLAGCQAPVVYVPAPPVDAPPPVSPAPPPPEKPLQPGCSSCGAGKGVPCVPGATTPCDPCVKGHDAPQDTVAALDRVKVGSTLGEVVGVLGRQPDPVPVGSSPIKVYRWSLVALDGSRWLLWARLEGDVVTAKGLAPTEVVR